MNKWLTGEWFIEQTSARRRRVIHYWATILWLTVGLVAWVIHRDALWFVGFMSLYAIWVTHIAGWAAETPVEAETADAQQAAASGPRAGGGRAQLGEGDDWQTPRPTERRRTSLLGGMFARGCVALFDRSTRPRLDLGRV